MRKLTLFIVLVLLLITSFQLVIFICSKSLLSCLPCYILIIVWVFCLSSSSWYALTILIFWPWHLPQHSVLCINISDLWWVCFSVFLYHLYPSYTYLEFCTQVCEIFNLFRPTKFSSFYLNFRFLPPIPYPSLSYVLIWFHWFENPLFLFSYKLLWGNNRTIGEDKEVFFLL